MKTSIKLLALVLVVLFNYQAVKANHMVTENNPFEVIILTVEKSSNISVLETELDDKASPWCTASANITIMMQGITQEVTVTVSDRCGRIKKTLNAAVNRILEALNQ